MSGKNATEMLAADAAGIARAARIIRNGGLVAVPTETVYGLAARADDPDAVARIYAAKGRPGFNPLIVHVDNLAQAQELADFRASALQMAQAVWPGPVTLVLPVKEGAALAPAVTAGLPTVALRMPQGEVMRQLIQESGCPLAAPSANLSNAISPTSAAHVAATLAGRIDLILDAGPCEKGLESTILALRHDGSWEILRHGPADLEQLHAIAAGAVHSRAAQAEMIEAPGQMARHYSPGKPLRLGVQMANTDEFLIGFGPITGHLNLSTTGDLVEAAGALYAALHVAAASDYPCIAVAPIPQHGIGAAINDRLSRAAA